MTKIHLHTDGSAKIGVFNAVTMILDNINQHNAHEPAEVLLKGFSQNELEAISTLLCTSFSMSLPDLPANTRLVKLAEGDKGRAMSIDFGKGRKITAENNAGAQSTYIHISAFPEGIPAIQAKQVLRNIRKMLTHDHAQAYIEGADYRLLPCPNKENMDLTLSLVSPLCMATGAQASDIVTISEGVKFDAFGGQRVPCVAIKEAAFQQFVAQERGRSV
jgi:hypothetical protein